MSHENSNMQHQAQPQLPDEPPHSATRRAFTKVVAGGVGFCYAAAIGYPVYRFLNSPVEKATLAAAVTEISLKDAQKLPSGSALIFKFGAEPCLLIHLPDGKWVAMSAKCTHLGCTVQYEPDKARIFCACHGGTYDPTNGHNIAGPPPKPLKSFVVKAVTDTEVVVSRV
jgi:cytochrome b6-f complex iron-sulfur subunit